VGILRAPTPVPGLTDIVEIVQEDNTAYALKSDGTVWVWGKNGLGQVRSWLHGDSEQHSDYRAWDGASADTQPTPTQAVPTQVEGLTDVQALATMQAYDKEERRHYSVSIFALKSDGTAATWGSNEYGQLGDGSVEDRWNPVEVVGLVDAISIVVIYRSVFALKSDGTVWAWGDNHRGRLGIGTSTDQHDPAQVAGLTDVESIHPCREVNGGLLAIRSDGSLWVVGSISDIGLGGEGVTPQVGKSRVEGLSEVTMILADGPVYVLANGTRPAHELQRESPREGCFVATAVYGDYDAPAVQTLRRYRDETLAASAIGRAFIEFYYRLSPLVAKRINQESISSRLCKRLLDSVVHKLDSHATAERQRRTRD